MTSVIQTPLKKEPRTIVWGLLTVVVSIMVGVVKMSVVFIGLAIIFSDKATERRFFIV